MKIHELLATKDNWTQGKYAADDHGHRVPVYDTSAKCWCLLGAIEKCYRDDSRFTVIEKIPRIVDINDSPTTTFKDIRELVERLDI